MVLLMYKLGLKLWSTNTGIYFEEAQRLYREKDYAYIELYVAPDSLDTLPKWESLNVPFTIHAPHEAHGLNLALDSQKRDNRLRFEAAREFADRLSADFIIVHGGSRGTIDSTAQQLAEFRDHRVLIENVPFRTLKDRLRCIGATPDEVHFLKAHTGCGFCLDFGHAVCSANAQGLEPYSYIRAFMELEPAMFHLSGVLDMTCTVDSHAPLNVSRLNRQILKSLLPQCAKVTVETAKASMSDLDDFRQDVTWIRSL